MVRPVQCARLKLAEPLFSRGSKLFYPVVANPTFNAVILPVDYSNPAFSICVFQDQHSRLFYYAEYPSGDVQRAKGALPIGL